MVSSGVSPKSSRYGFVVGLLIGAVCLGLAVRSVDPHELLKTFSRLDPLYTILALALTLAHAFVQAIKWQLFISPLGRHKFSHCFWSVRLGFFFNAVLPAKLGEGIRIWFMHKNGGLSFSQGIGALVADRFIDFAALVLVFYFSLNFIVVDFAWFPKESAGLLLLAFLVLILILNFLPGNKGPKWLQKIIRILHQVRHGLKSLKSPRILFSTLLVSILGWIIQISVMVVLSKGLGLTLEWPELTLVIAAVTLATALPSAPSSFGTFELAAVFVLTKFFQIGNEEALALALLYHFVQLIITWGVGFIGYVRYHETLVPQIKRLKNKKSA